MQATAENTRPPVRGVIDTVSAGYTLVGRHPWLIAIPIVLDLLLWAGPRLGIAPLIADFLRVTATPADLGPEYVETLQIARESLTAMGQSFQPARPAGGRVPGRAHDHRRGHHGARPAAGGAAGL